MNNIVKKLKLILKILFPRKADNRASFLFQVKSNSQIVEVVESSGLFFVKTKDNLNLIIRNEKHSDYNVFEQVITRKEYFIVLKVFEYNKAAIGPVAIIDAGANVGYTTLFFLSNIPNARVFGIEPDLENFKYYRENIALNDFTEQVIFYNNALSERENASYRLSDSFRDGKDWARSTIESGYGEIKGVTISEIVKNNQLDRISILKIDIEGAERFIFNSKNDLSFLIITQIIAIEIHDEFNIRDNIFKILVDNNFILFESGELTIGVNKLLV